jgi:formate hydrogenlyase transcriptional activator
VNLDTSDISSIYKFAGEHHRSNRPRIEETDMGTVIDFADTYAITESIRDNPAAESFSAASLSEIEIKINTSMPNRTTAPSEVDRGQVKESRLNSKDRFLVNRNFPAIIGKSPVLQTALNMVGIVAPTNSNVMIVGETGTGKELVARSIHDLSTRRERTFVKVNCAAIPLGLLESELFGHERGAFTGAVTQKIGRFDLANKGTLFLDEIGDIPLELQAKLLRVLQEQEFERLGSNRTHKVNVRIIAATHRNLAAMVEQGTFREDLYYRLWVFPINVPALRQRTEDIPDLVWHFVELYSRRMNKIIDEIPSETMDALVRHHWPGNVRELQNFIERAVILSSHTTLRAPISDLEPFTRHAVRTLSATVLEDLERDYILRALEASKWVVGGSKGAAERLGMKRTSLAYKMRKFGLIRPKSLSQDFKG